MYLITHTIHLYILYMKWQLSFVLEFDRIKSEGCWLKLKLKLKQVKVNSMLKPKAKPPLLGN